ncbi:MAG: FlgO family outer membrane protein [Candidatus Magnetominusculus sp. LBB02]|nr:FlgO family outer membrane protein [Candidatus Magnetominusculus sp. LBB02]
MKRQMSNLAAALIFMAALLTVSCQKAYTVPKTDEMPSCSIFHFEENPADNMTDIDLKAAYIVELLSNNGDIPKYADKIIVTTFVELNNLNKTSMFGRLIAEQILSQMHMAGYRMVDIREMKSIVMADKIGELYLSRGGLPGAHTPVGKIEVTPKMFNFNYKGALIVAGTYQVEPCEVFVNVRLINPELGEVFSVASVKIPMTRLIKYLLSKSNELKDEPAPSIRLRQNETTPVVKAPETVKKVIKSKPKPKKPKKKPKKNVEKAKPADEAAHGEQVKPEEPAKPTAQPAEPAKAVEPATK